MNWKRLIGVRDEEEEEKDYHDWTLNDLDVGYMVDYDLQTWNVTGRNIYDYDGDRNEEWVLRSGDEVRFLECSEDDGRKRWSWTRRIGLEEIAEPVADMIIRSEDPPEEIHYNGKLYHGTESSAGLFLENGEGPEREFIVWTYEADDDNEVLFISQWGERDFSAYHGRYVEEYQFTDILPQPKE